MKSKVEVSRASVGLLEQQQFEAAVEGRRLSEKTKCAARDVLVMGQSQTQAAINNGMRIQAVNRAVLSIARVIHSLKDGRCRICGQRVLDNHGSEERMEREPNQQDADGSIPATDAQRQGSTQGTGTVVQ